MSAIHGKYEQDITRNIRSGAPQDSQQAASHHISHSVVPRSILADLSYFMWNALDCRMTQHNFSFQCDCVTPEDISCNQCHILRLYI